MNKIKKLLLVLIMLIMTVGTSYASDGGAQFKSFGPFFDSSGDIYTGIYVKVYAAGTTNAKTYWTDEAKTTAVATGNLIDSDSDGVVYAYFDGDYRFQIKQSDGSSDLDTAIDWDNVKVTSDTATLWEGNQGTSYPSVVTNNTWQLAVKKDGAGLFSELGINNGTSFQTLIEKNSDDSANVFDDIITKGPWVDVRAYGVTGDGSTDDTSNIQAAIDASSEGDIIYFPAGTYLISAPLVFKEYRTYVGNHYHRTYIKQKASSNISTAMIVDEGWNNDDTTSTNPIVIRDLFIDGNKGNNAGATTDGIRLMTYRSLIEDVFIYQVTGDGIAFVETNSASGTITGTAVENRVDKCIISQVDGDGISNEGSTSALTDGYITETIIASVGEAGINLGRGAGWHLMNNYIYDAGYSGIVSAKSGSLILTGNHIESFGGSATTGTYRGILASQISDAIPVSINNNMVYNGNDVSGSTYIATELAYGSGITTGEISFSNNHIQGTFDTGITISGTGYGTTLINGNVVTGAAQSNTILTNTGNASNTIQHVNNSFDIELQTLAGSGTPSILYGSIFNTLANNIIYSNFTNGFQGQTINVSFAFPRGSGYVDFTGTNLKGNSGQDWFFSQNDDMTCTFNGTNWLCLVNDATTAAAIVTLDDDATPSVSGVTKALTGGTTTITDFDDGVTGQVLMLISEHAITITDGTNIFLNGSANFVMAATDTLTLIQKADGKWYELSRSDNT
jgi:hypothetical protein